MLSIEKHQVRIKRYVIIGVGVYRWILIDDFLPMGPELSNLIDGRIRYCAVEFFAAECTRRIDRALRKKRISPTPII